MPRNFRIHELKLMSNVSNQEERRQYRPGEFAMLPDAAIAAMFAPRKAWLRMLHEHNSTILKTYEEVFWFIPSFCMFPLESAQRSFAVYIECQQCITESVEQQSKAANSALRIGRTHSGIEEPGDSLEHAMDVAIGAEGEPWFEVRAACLGY